MTAEEWNKGWVRCIGLQLNGRTLDDVNGVGEPIRDETYMILLNPHHEPIKFYMPQKPGSAWDVVLDSSTPAGAQRPALGPGDFHELEPRSTALLRELTD